MDLKTRDVIESQAPAAACRTVEGGLFDETGALIAICGLTFGKFPGHSVRFAETPRQVARDISEFGYQYWGTEEALLAVNGDGCLVGPDGEPYSFLAMGDPEDWRSMHRLCQENVEYYRRIRLTNF